MKVSKDFQTEYFIRQDVTFDLIVPFLGQYLHSLATLIGTPCKYHGGTLFPSELPSFFIAQIQQAYEKIALTATAVAVVFSTLLQVTKVHWHFLDCYTGSHIAASFVLCMCHHNLSLCVREFCTL